MAGYSNIDFHVLRNRSALYSWLPGAAITFVVWLRPFIAPNHSSHWPALPPESTRSPALTLPTAFGKRW